MGLTAIRRQRERDRGGKKIERGGPKYKKREFYIILLYSFIRLSSNCPNY